MARTVLIPPREHCWVASDAYDRSAFAELSAATPTLAELAARGGALVPCFRELLEDFFCLLFKLDPRLRAADEVAPAAAFNRALLATLDGHPALAALRAETQLDEAQAGLGALLLGTRVLEALRAEQLVPRGDLLDLWDLARQEDELRRRGEEADALAEAPRAAREEATHAARVAEARLRQKAQNVAQRLGEMPGRARTMLPAAAAALAPELADVARAALARAPDRARPAACDEPQAPPARGARRPHARPRAGAPPPHARARERRGARRRMGRRLRPAPAAGAARAPPPAAPPRLPPPAPRGRAARLPAARRRVGTGAHDRVRRRLVVDGGREGGLGEGGGAHAARDRAPPAPPLPLRVLRGGRHAAVHARPEPARAPRGACRPRARRRRVLPRGRHRLRDAARCRRGRARRGALAARGRRAHHRRRVRRLARVARALPAGEGPPRVRAVFGADRRGRRRAHGHARRAQRPRDERLTPHRRRRARALRRAWMTGALAGLRVLDLADRPGALCGRLLAELGADVVLVEPPEGSPLRAIPPFWQGAPDPARSVFFWFYALGKRSIVAEPALLERLLARADVVIETGPPGAGPALAARHPHLVVASITPF